METLYYYIVILYIYKYRDLNGKWPTWPTPNTNLIYIDSQKRIASGQPPSSMAV